jgi:hypothetical protein
MDHQDAGTFAWDGFVVDGKAFENGVAFRVLDRLRDEVSSEL